MNAAEHSRGHANATARSATEAMFTMANTKSDRRPMSGRLAATATLAMTITMLGMFFNSSEAQAPTSNVSASVSMSSLNDDLSYIDPNISLANLRSCPSVPNYGASDCAPVDQIPGGASVRMICWTVGNPPARGSSAKWFWVEESSGTPNPGWRGYMWSDLVWEQAQVPNCDDVDPSVIGNYTGNFPDPSSDTGSDATTDTTTDTGGTVDYSTTSGTPQVSLGIGPAAPYGYRYAVSVSGFTPGSVATVGCFDSVDPLSPFYTFSLFIDGNGNGYAENQCYSGDGPNHWVSVDGNFSNPVAW